MTKFYMRVTNDRYELPLSPPLHASELAELLGVDVHVIYRHVFNGERKCVKPTTLAFVKVDISSDD